MHTEGNWYSAARRLFGLLSGIALYVVLMAPAGAGAETIPPVTTPSPIMGTYATGQNVTLTCSDSGSGCATTYFCLGNGCTPTTPYSEPVSISTSGELRFYSIDLDGNSEQVRTYSYTIDPNLAYRFQRLWPKLEQPWYFANPAGVTVAADGSVYIVDTDNNRIQKFDAGGAFVTTWGTYGDGPGQFTYPVGITVDPAGNVYVADSGNNRIQKFTSAGTFVTVWGSSGVDNGQFIEPAGIAADSSGNIYVADAGNNRVQKFDPSGVFMAVWGEYGGSEGQLNYPSGIAIGPDGTVYVVDAGNNRIQKFSATGFFVSGWGGTGDADGQFNLPSGISVDPGGDVYVTDAGNNRIQKFTLSGAYVSSWGAFGSGGGMFNNPRGLARDAAGNLFVADTFNNRIQKFDASGSFLSAWSSSGIADGQLDTPYGITVAESAGYVYVADTNNNRIQEFNSSGAFVRSWGSQGSGNGQFNFPQGVTLDSSGLVYVADSGNNRIQKFNAWGTLLAIWGESGSGDGQFSSPTGIAVDHAGTMYVLDTGNDRVQKLSSDGSFISAWGSSGSGEGQFDTPRGIALDADGNVYVADTENNRIQKFDPNGAFIASWGSYGTDAGQFDSPRGIAVDSTQNIYVADSNNNRIQMFTGNGVFITLWGSRGSGNGQFTFVQGIALDSATGNVHLADTGNNRIQKFMPPLLAGAPTGVTAAAGYGQATVSFLPPAVTGSSPILFYKVTSTPGNLTATGTSPITVMGLSGGTSYTFTVAAINSGGTGPASNPSNSIIPESGYLLTVAAEGSGTVHSSPGPDINCSGYCAQSYASGSVVTLAASPGSGYTFAMWSGACSGSGSCTLTMDQARTVTARFVPIGINGACGSANNGNYALAPATNLCAMGTTSSVTGIGPWFWNCAGIGGGATASCSANQAGGIVHRSSDAGATWTPGKTGLGFNNPTNALLVSPTYTSDHTLFIGANNGIYKSSDSGDSWTQVSSAYKVTSLSASPAYASDHTLFAGAYTTGVHKSTDSGATWTQTNTGLGSTSVFSLAVSPAHATDRTVFAGLYGKGVYKSTDGGISWSAANSGIDTITPLSLAVSPAFATDQTIYAATTDGQYSGGGPHYHLYKSSDAGVSWALADTGIAGAISKLGISPAFATDHSLFAVTSSGIYKSSDRGTTWTQVSSLAAVDEIVLSPAYASDQTLMVNVYGDTVYRSSNGGSSWSPAASGFTVGNKQLVALALSPAYASDHMAFTATYLAGPYSLVSPGSLSFGSVTAGSSSASQRVTITNGNGMFGDANLAITGMTVSGATANQFTISAGSCGSLTPVLPVGGSCSIDVTFTPTSAGSKSSILQISHNEPIKSRWDIGLSGSGTVEVNSAIVTPVTGFVTNGTSVGVSGTASCFAGDTVATVEVSADGGSSWQTATGTTSWSISLSTPLAGSYTIRSRATTAGGVVETPAAGVTVKVDRTAPSATLALYYGVWTLNADARDGNVCLMFYPSICGSVEISADGASWQPATTTPGSGGPFWLRDRAGNVSSVSGVIWNSNGGPILQASSLLYYSSLQPAYDGAQTGDTIKLTQSSLSESLVLARSGTITIRGGYDASHGAVSGTTPLNGSLTVQGGTPVVENLDIAGNMEISGGTVTVGAVSIR